MGEGEGWTGSLGLVEANLLHLEWVNHVFLMYRTGNYIQDPVINHNGREKKREKNVSMHARTYVYNRVTLLYSRDWHNSANQFSSGQFSRSVVSDSSTP